MARPNPPPELRRSRHTIAIPMMVTVAAWALPKKKPTLQLKDFSDTAAKALTDYIEKHDPGGLERAVDKIREYQATPSKGDLRAAEEPGAYGGGAAAGPSVDELAAGEAKRRKRSESKGHGGGTRDGARPRTGRK